ncbi:hypothetical protein [Galbibacter sp.]
MKKYLFTWISMCCFLFSIAEEKHNMDRRYPDTHLTGSNPN